MTWIRTAVRELLGLFVDDGHLAVAVIVWLAIVGWVLPRLGVVGVGQCAALSGGFVVILAESTVRRVRASRQPR